MASTRPVALRKEDSNTTLTEMRKQFDEVYHDAIGPILIDANEQGCECARIASFFVVWMRTLHLQQLQILEQHLHHASASVVGLKTAQKQKVKKLKKKTQRRNNKKIYPRYEELTHQNPRFSFTHKSELIGEEIGLSTSQVARILRKGLKDGDVHTAQK